MRGCDMSVDYRVLDVNENISFKKKIEAINWCTEKNYKSNASWQQACWPSNRPKSTNFRIWFPKLSEKKNGEYVPTTDGFVNYLSEDWEFFIFDDINGKNENQDPDDRYSGMSIVFAKDFGGDYIFRGAYEMDMEKSGPNHFVHKRIATRIKLIGKPVQRYELLDDANIHEPSGINTPIKPKGIVRKSDGTIRYICGRCGQSFNKAPRCPSCGQLVKE